MWSQATSLISERCLYYSQKSKKVNTIGQLFSKFFSTFRQYTDEDLEALSMICCLKNTGMSLKDIARFMALTREGDQTLRARCEMLKNHRETVLEKMEEMQRHLDKVTCKYHFFSKKLKAYEAGEKKQDNGRQR